MMIAFITLVSAATVLIIYDKRLWWVFLLLAAFVDYEK